MATQILLCVETNKRANTDWIYIMDTIHKYYCIRKDISIKPIYMNSKGNYKSRSVAREINDMKKMFRIGPTIVIYCIDTDHFETNFEQRKETAEVITYCRQQGYEIMWFCHDIEEVYLGHSISNQEKVISAGRFRNNLGIDQIPERLLRQNEMRTKSSNILNVLDKYLARKNSK